MVRPGYAFPRQYGPAVCHRCVHYGGDAFVGRVVHRRIWHHCDGIQYHRRHLDGYHHEHRAVYHPDFGDHHPVAIITGCGWWDEHADGKAAREYDLVQWPQGSSFVVVRLLYHDHHQV